jgi:hypothetical protein
MPPEQPILACIPDDPAARGRVAAVTGQPCLPYRDSARGVCARCLEAVWIGPEQRKRQHAAWKAGTLAVVLCLECVAKVTALTGARFERLSDKKPGE